MLIAPGVSPGLDGDIDTKPRGDGFQQRMDGRRGVGWRCGEPKNIGQGFTNDEGDTLAIVFSCLIFVIRGDT